MRFARLPIEQFVCCTETPSQKCEQRLPRLKRGAFILSRVRYGPFHLFDTHTPFAKNGWKGAAQTVGDCQMATHFWKTTTTDDVEKVRED